MTFVVKNIVKHQVFPHCTLTHMTDLMTYPYTTNHISLKIPSVFKLSHNNMVRSAEERFAMERMATRGFGSKKIATTLGLPPHPLRRCVGKQTPAAPELQLRDVVWSDESFFQLRELPIHQNTRICRGSAISRNCLGTCLSRNLTIDGVTDGDHARRWSLAS